MNNYLSNKLRFFSFILMILVVLLHADLIKYSYGLSSVVQQFLTYSITRIAVPLFFIISGYLFFCNKEVSFQFFKLQLLKRLKSLFIPYLLLSVIGYTLLFVIDDFSISFVNLLCQPPSLFYQLWFLRDLMFCVCISPIIYFFIKKLDWLAVMCFFLLVRYFFVIEGSSIFDFSLGVYLALHKFSFIQGRNQKTERVWILGIIWLIGCIFQTKFHNYNYPYLFHINILIGICFMWRLYDVFYDVYIKKTLDSWILSTSFFIYLFHEPLLTLMRKSALMLNPSPNYGTFIIYLGSFFLAVIICIFFAYQLDQRFPQIYRIITGGRPIKK